MPCILITYFKYLYEYFNYLTTLQANTQYNLGFSHALQAARAVWLNAQNCAWFSSQISVICCELSGTSSPEPLTRGCAPGLRWGTSVPQAACAPLPPNPDYATAIR